MGLVECILGEFLPVLPDLVQSLFRVPVLHATFHELALEVHKDVDLLLPHGLAEPVRITLGEAGQFLGQEHHLLLVDRDSVSVLEVFLHLRQVVLDLFGTELPCDEVRDVVHRAWSVEGVHCDQVLEPLRMEFLEPLFHPGGFELEHRVGVSAAVESVGLLVVDGDGLYVDILTLAEFYVVQALVDDGEGVQPQEIHLQHAYVFDVVAVVLAGPDHLAGVLVLGQADRDVVGEGTPSDNGCAGVHSDLADASLQFLGELEHVLYLVRTLLQGILQLRNQAVAVLQGDLDVDLLHTLLEGLPVFLEGLESGHQFIQLGIERVDHLLLLAQAVGDQSGQPD